MYDYIKILSGINLDDNCSQQNKQISCQIDILFFHSILTPFSLFHKKILT